MPYSLTVNDTTRTYTVTTPNWCCEWIVTSLSPIKRQCYLTDSTLDILDTADAAAIHDLFPEIRNEIDLAIKEWNTSGDTYASSLLNPENIPSYLAYAKQGLLSHTNR